VNIGVGGQIETPADLIDAEPRSIATIQVKAKLGAAKHKFEDDGSVSESTILTLDAKSFTIIDVAPPPPIAEQLPLDEDDD
jgi:hypothetical protein